MIDRLLERGSKDERGGGTTQPLSSGSAKKAPTPLIGTWLSLLVCCVATGLELIVGPPRAFRS